LIVQAKPSSHDATLGGCVHVPELHTSSVHGLPSAVHGAAFAGCVHAPPLHTSFVHALPSSLHGPVF
jgi:hypothetical protein